MHNLTNAQKKSHVNWCQEILKKYNQGTSQIVYNIYTGVESWMYTYEPETKQQTVWVFPNEQNPTKVVHGRSTQKKMVVCFFGMTSHIAIVALEKHRNLISE